MRATTAIQAAILLAVVALGGYAVSTVVDGWASWVVLGGIIITTYGVMVAYHHRRYPAQTTKRSIRREPGEAYLPSSKQGRDNS